jgi:hypothetical protein
MKLGKMLILIVPTAIAVVIACGGKRGGGGSGMNIKNANISGLYLVDMAWNLCLAQ